MNAPEKAMEVKALLVGIFSLVTGILGWVGVAVTVVVVCMFLDYLTGSWAARAHGEWSSAVAREGLWHKLGEIVALLVAALADIAVQVVISSAAAPFLGDVTAGFGHGAITLIVSLWYIFTELGSILENCAKLGAPVPERLVKGIGKLKKKVDEKDPFPKTDEDKKDPEE